VIRAASADSLGQNIVVQGGTFLNDAVLRAFELELGRNVTRPTIAGLMGAFGAALAARDLHLEQSSLLSESALQAFSHTSKPVTCGLCTNHCSLTVNQFDGGRKFISGNRCSRPLGEEKADVPDLMLYKYHKLRAMNGKGDGDGSRGRMGIPFGLNMYENLPFWFAFLTKLNFEVVLSPESSRKIYLKGQLTIPSDTVCYPAKLLHGHVEALVEDGVDAIFYPCMPYNFNEGAGDNNYNCPVVAYYPELLAANVTSLQKTKYLTPYFGLHRPKDFEKKAADYFSDLFDIPKKETVAAARAAYQAYDAYKEDIRHQGQVYTDYARAHNLPILVVAGRPYHADPEVNHGINDLITSFHFVLLTEDAVAYQEGYQSRKVLNQWTYHSRMYNAARYVVTQPDMQLIQLVSFGCGIDAITGDEVRSILEGGGKLYTQLKIDDINNLGAVKIRIRSLIAAIDAREGTEET
ncbi:MAG: acyl-CoA dehydratase activase-related protein, partial [Oscillospiraceae bacterium]